MRSIVLTTLFVSLAMTFAADLTVAGDWPQILGPTRNGVAQKESIASSWSDGKPKAVWEMEVGQGFAGVSVVDGVAVLFHRVGNEEIAEGLNAKTGEKLWLASSPTEYQPSFNPDAGPRAVPVIQEGLVYLYGARGGLSCVQLADGKHIRDEFQDKIVLGHGVFDAGRIEAAAADSARFD